MHKKNNAKNKITIVQVYTESFTVSKRGNIKKRACRPDAIRHLPAGSLSICLKTVLYILIVQFYEIQVIQAAYQICASRLHS
jgi:hypothetical protein